MSGTIPGLAPGWVDQLWHEMKAQGRAKLAPVREQWLEHGCAAKTITPDHKQRMREGLQRYHEKRRAAKAGK